uniref:SH3 domain-containing protein n=1 Tax=Chrysolophus pictus TaxID=9089 RepID=A0A8C3L1U4_CHRPC
MGWDRRHSPEGWRWGCVVGLAVLIARMQTNADQVEKDILETQSLLTQDVSNEQKNKAFEFQAENARNLKEAETLLKDLFLDVDRAKRLKHPQANEIEKDIQQLHERVTQLCAEYRDLYEKLNVPDIGPRVDWAKILDQKMKQVNAGQYGPGMSELEKQIAEHNILQKEIEAYGLQIKNLRCRDVTDLKSQYKDLLKASIWRGQSLGSLYHHLQGCTKELGYLTERQTRILKQDWSDQMTDVQSMRREYEDFKSKELLSQEEFVNNLQDDGDRMIELKHPAVKPIQAHQEALKNEWQNFLNLCICQESQLKSVENYKKFQDDAETVSRSLKKMSSDLDTKYTKFNKDSPGVVSDLLLHLEAVKQAEKSIADLKKRSKEISPLKLRRMRSSQPLTLDTLCDWDAGEVQLTRGDKYTLKDNSNPEMWVVQSSTGVVQEAPSACFSIPPPDPEAMDKQHWVSLWCEFCSQATRDYELQAGKYSSSLDPALTDFAAKRLRVTPLQESIQAQENDVSKHYMELAAENRQQLSRLEFAKKIVEKKEVHEDIQSVHEQTQQSANKATPSRESEGLKLQLEEERRNVARIEEDLEEHRNKLLTLKTQRPVERVEEKEVVEYYRDPQMESNLTKMMQQIEEEGKKRQSLQENIEVMSRKLAQMESEKKAVPAQLLTKEITKIEKDPSLDSQAASLRQEIRRLQEESLAAASELEQCKRELHVLEKKQPNIREKVVVKELIKTEKNPEMLKSVRNLQLQIDEESFKRKSAEEAIVKVKSKIEEVEKLIDAAEPKIIVKEVKQVEQDPELLKESSKLKTLIEEERSKNLALAGELGELQSQCSIAEKQKPRVEVKERVNEIFMVDPETEKEIAHLKRELQEVTLKRTKIDSELEEALAELSVLRSQKPEVELKEVIEEVVKHEKSPEILREIDRLKQQLNELVNTNGRTQEQLIRLQGERDEWKRERSKVETKLVNKEVIRYENDPLLEKEADRLRQEVRSMAQKRRAAEDAVYDLQNKYMLLERRKPEEKVIVQEVILTQKDPKLRDEHNRLSRSLDEEVSNRRRLERDVQQLRALVEEQEKLLNFQEDRSKRLALEKEMRQITLRIKELEESPAPVQEKIIMEEVVKLEKDPVLEQSASNLRLELDREKMEVLNLQRECKNLQMQVDVLQKAKSQEKTIYKEVIRVEKDRALENERARIWEQLNRERGAKQKAEEEVRRLREKIERAEGMKRTWAREETELQKARNLAIQERASLESELRELERQKQQKVLFLREESKLLNQRTESDRQKKKQLEQEFSMLEADILREKDQIYNKERFIRDLRSRVSREEINHETQMRETNLSTKISILDPETGKDMSPYEAYKRGIIDRGQYIQLQELECDWEEITTLGPNGEVSVLLDKKSGKQYSIDDALRLRRITKEEYQLYRDGKIPISEFALLVAGESKPPSSLSIGSIISKSPIQSPTTPQTQSFFPPGSQKGFSDDTSPIAGVYDTTTDTKYNIKTAVTKKLLDPMTAQKLLEAQAATGGIIDLLSRDRLSVHKAIERGLIDRTYMQRLLNAQKAFTGIEDPVTKRRLSVGEAVQKGWMTKDSAFPYLEVQHLTGGLIDPKKTGRIPVLEAAHMGMITGDLANRLQDESSYEKDLIDPITKEKVNYKEAMALCQKDSLGSLLLLPAASEGYQPYRSPKLSRFRH